MTDRELLIYIKDFLEGAEIDNHEGHPSAIYDGRSLISLIKIIHEALKDKMTGMADMTEKDRLLRSIEAMTEKDRLIYLVDMYMGAVEIDHYKDRLSIIIEAELYFAFIKVINKYCFDINSAVHPRLKYRPDCDQEDLKSE